MDPFLLVIWIVRLLFLALLYLFLARVVGSLLRDLRAAAREPGASPGRLVVVESPAGEPERRPLVRPRCDHDTRAGREQRDRDRRSVRLVRARGPDVPRPELVRRGSRQHERDVRERAGRRRRSRRSGSATRCRSVRSAFASNGRAPRDASLAVVRPVGSPLLRGSSRPIRPRPRWTEARLLALAAVALVVGSLSLRLGVDGEFGLADASGPRHLPRAPSPARMWRRSSPDAAPTRCSCPWSACWAASRCCSCSAFRRAS